MRDTDLDLLLVVVVGRENLIYFTGLTETECMAVLIPRAGEAGAVTHWLDAPNVREMSGLTTSGYVFPREKLVDKVVEWIHRYGLCEPRIGFERYFVDFAMYEGLQRAFPETSFTGAGDLFYRVRSVKDEQEVQHIRRTAQAVCCGMEAAVRAVRPGVTELDILAEAEYAMLKAGSHGCPFRSQVVSGARTLLTHPCASDKKVSPDEIVVIHLGTTWQGYCAKICRTAPGRADGYRIRAVPDWYAIFQALKRVCRGCRERAGIIRCRVPVALSRGEGGKTTLSLWAGRDLAACKMAGWAMSIPQWRVQRGNLSPSG